MTTSYLIGLGSNRRHGRYGRPGRVIAAAVDALAGAGLEIVAVSPLMRTPALGPGGRDFANAAALVRTPLAPPALLRLLKRIERDFGRRTGRRWGARVLDCDILMMEAGAWPPPPRRAAPGALAVPHARLTERNFALRPAAALAPEWRHPRARATLRQLAGRLVRPRPVDRRGARS